MKENLKTEHRFLGYGKNSDGVVGLCGQLTVTRGDGQELKGSLETSNPLLFISPTTLKGESCTVTYWMPPVAFPHPSGQLNIKTPSESCSLNIRSLFPASRTDFWSEKKVLAALTAPALIGALYFCFVFWYLGSQVNARVKELFPDNYEAALNGLEPPGFLTRSFGLYHLEVLPSAESLQLIWAATIFFVPLVTAKIFRHLSRQRQQRYSGLLAGCQLLPSGVLIVLWNLQKEQFPLFDHPDLSPMSLASFLDWAIPLNVAVSVYLFLSVFGLWDRWLRMKEVRFALPIVLTGLYALTVLTIIFGRSWTA